MTWIFHNAHCEQHSGQPQDLCAEFCLMIQDTCCYISASQISHSCDNPSEAMQIVSSDHVCIDVLVLVEDHTTSAVDTFSFHHRGDSCGVPLLLLRWTTKRGTAHAQNHHTT